eukprot:scaffold1581_cov342-Prasinococcus_capsulatus_cf.AAC.17
MMPVCGATNCRSSTCCGASEIPALRDPPQPSELCSAARQRRCRQWRSGTHPSRRKARARSAPGHPRAPGLPPCAAPPWRWWAARSLRGARPAPAIPPTAGTVSRSNSAARCCTREFVAERAPEERAPHLQRGPLDQAAQQGWVDEDVVDARALVLVAHGAELLPAREAPLRRRVRPHKRVHQAQPRPLHLARPPPGRHTRNSKQSALRVRGPAGRDAARDRRTASSGACTCHSQWRRHRLVRGEAVPRRLHQLQQNVHGDVALWLGDVLADAPHLLVFHHLRDLRAQFAAARCRPSASRSPTESLHAIARRGCSAGCTYLVEAHGAAHVALVLELVLERERGAVRQPAGDD